MKTEHVEIKSSISGVSFILTVKKSDADIVESLLAEPAKLVRVAMNRAILFGHPYEKSNKDLKKHWKKL